MIRLLWRLPAILALSALGYLAVLVGNGVAALTRGPLPAWRLGLFRLWARAVLAILGARVVLEGRPPSPPFLLVANHLGYVDIALLAAQAPAAFVAREDLSRWPFWGVMSRSVGTIYVDRGAKRDLPRAAAEIERALARGIGVVLFPEGTSSDGSGVLPFRPSLLDPAARLGIPVHWATITYRALPGEPPASRSVCWAGSAPFLPHFLHLLRLRGFEAVLAYGEAPLADRDRKTLARDLEEAVRRALAPAGAA